MVLLPLPVLQLPSSSFYKSLHIPYSFLHIIQLQITKYSHTLIHKMCSSKAKAISPVASIDGRPVLQPGGNRVVPALERRDSLKKTAAKVSPSPIPSPSPLSMHFGNTKTTPPISPKMKSPRPPALKRGNDPHGLNSSMDKTLTPQSVPKLTTLVRKKSKKSMIVGANAATHTVGVAPSMKEPATLTYASSLITEAPGSIAAARREQVTLVQAQRKLKIAHYGRTKSGKFDGNLATVEPLSPTSREKRCTFITPNSDPLYVVYHDEEWGVPAHDDKLLFEMLILSGAQVGSDWTSTLKKRQDFKEAFSGFDAEIVANLSEKQITSISAKYNIELSRVRGVVDNSNRILEIKNTFGSFDQYLWGFVNHRPIYTQYKTCHKIPVKTSKSETISKDMVRRGFRSVGPTVMHSFMQAAGLTNDHLTTCPRHLQCIALASQYHATAAPTQ